MPFSDRAECKPLCENFDVLATCTIRRSMIQTSQEQSQWRRRAKLLQSVCRLRFSEEKTVVLFPQSSQDQVSIRAFRTTTTDTTEGANAAFSIGLELQASRYSVWQTQQQRFQTFIHPQVAHEDPKRSLKVESTRHALLQPLPRPQPTSYDPKLSIKMIRA